jgi:hypothetical protein
MVSKKETHDIRETIKKMILDTDRTIENVQIQEGKWIVQVKQGPLILYVIHPEGQPFMGIVFPGILEKEVGEALTAVFNDPKSGKQNLFGLKAIINNPLCEYRIHEKDGIFMGYEISTKIFPFEERFSIAQLDAAFRTVVSIGVLGVDYMRALGGVLKVNQKAVDNPPTSSSNEGMYG